MKIDGFEIENFAKEEYTQDQEPNIQNIDGQSLLIKGPNRSGKSLTFNALLYSLLGPTETIDTSTGKGNKVWVTFTDGSRFFRGSPHRKYEIGNKSYAKDNADKKLNQRIGDAEIIKQHFLHSHLNELPLDRLNMNDLIGIILSATDDKRKEEINELVETIESLDEELIEAQDKISPLKRRKDRLEFQVSKFEGQLSDWTTIVNLIEEGRLEQISDILSDNERIRSELEELSKRETGLRRKINSKEKRRDEIKQYDREIEEIIIEAMKEFVCPVCEGKVNSKSSRKRLRNNSCPFCNQDHSVQEVKDNLREKKSDHKGKAGELIYEIAEHEQELAQVQDQIQKLEQELPEISELNSLAVRRLEDGKSIDEIESEAREEIKLLKDSLQSHQEELDSVSEKLESSQSKVEQIESQLDNKEEKLNSVQQDSQRNEITDFEEVWTRHFRNIGDELGQTITIDHVEKAIVLPGGEDGKRKYSTRGDLSDSEIQLLNLSFVLALNDCAVDTNKINWKTIVLDEPFAHLDGKIKNNCLNYLLDINQQVILTSSDEYIESQFGKDQTVELERRQYEQSTLFDQGGGEQRLMVERRCYRIMKQNTTLVYGCLMSSVVKSMVRKNSTSHLLNIGMRKI